MTADRAIRSVTVLGATGSIGTSTLDLIGQTPDQFELVALTAQTNAAALAALAIKHRAQVAVIGNEAHYGELKDLLAGTGIASAAGGDDGGADGAGTGAFGVMVSTAPQTAFGQRTFTGEPPDSADFGTTMAALHFVQVSRT